MGEIPHFYASHRRAGSPTRCRCGRPKDDPCHLDPADGQAAQRAIELTAQRARQLTLTPPAKGVRHG